MSCYTGSRVRKLRAALAIPQQEMAIRLGVTDATVHRWETGKTEPSPLAQRRLHELAEMAETLMKRAPSAKKPMAATKAKSKPRRRRH